MQPIIWSYNDSLSLTPHPDYLIIADECEDFSYRFHVEEGTDPVQVLNPGNFSKDKSFVLLFPTDDNIDDRVQLSKLPSKNWGNWVIKSYLIN